LDESLALTHNYVSTSNLSDVLRFLRDKTDQISGVRDRNEEAVPPAEMHDLFVERLGAVLPRACLDGYILDSRSNRSSSSSDSHIPRSIGSIITERSRHRCMKGKRRHALTRRDDRKNCVPERVKMSREIMTTGGTDSGHGGEQFLFDFKFQ